MVVSGTFGICWISHFWWGPIWITHALALPHVATGAVYSYESKVVFGHYILMENNRATHSGGELNRGTLCVSSMWSHIILTGLYWYFYLHYSTLVYVWQLRRDTQTPVCCECSASQWGRRKYLGCSLALNHGVVSSIARKYVLHLHRWNMSLTSRMGRIQYNPGGNWKIICPGESLRFEACSRTIDF